MDRRIKRIIVNELFGRLTHDIEVRNSEPTILTAPNGAGKTHVLMLVNAAFSLNTRVLLALPFSKLAITLNDARGLAIERAVDDEADSRLWISATRFGKVFGHRVSVSQRDLEEFDSRIPQHIQQLNNGQWYDRRVERVIPVSVVERRYPILINGERETFFKGASEILAICREPSPILIDTKRLDAPIGRLGGSQSPEETRGGGTLGVTRIGQYVNELQTQVGEARRNSIQATQSADLSFAARALAAASETVKEGPLHQRYDNIVERYEDLARNSLAVGDAPLSFPAKTTPTVRRILNVFLDDWEKRLEPLLPLNDKISTLREILDSKLAQSGKKTVMSTRGSLGFRTFTDQPIRVASLSSGEQHLVALFTMLLFSANSGSFVLIDEPEISLHAAWKHSFLDDISRVARVMNLQIIIATHSTSIVNGRWDLTEELTFSAYSDSTSYSASDRSSQFGDDLESDDLLD